MVTFEPVEHQKAPAAVFNRIRDAILSGTLPSGTQLPAARIAEEMKISRSPVHEAISRLAEEGLVEKVAFRGAYVASVSPATIAEIASIRVLVEPHVIDLALARLKAGDWRVLEQVIAKLAKATDRRNGTGQIEEHLAFHRFFYERCGNQELLAMWVGWESKLQLFYVIDHDAFVDPRDVVAVHDDLVATFRSGDPERIRSAVIHHIHGAPGTEAYDTET